MIFVKNSLKSYEIQKLLSSLLMEHLEHMEHLLTLKVSREYTQILKSFADISKEIITLRGEDRTDSEVFNMKSIRKERTGMRICQHCLKFREIRAECDGGCDLCQECRKSSQSQCQVLLSWLGYKKYVRLQEESL